MKIVIGLTEHMGDIVACEPVVKHLKETYPSSTLSWAVMPSFRDLIDTNPLIDKTIILECLTDWIKLTKHEVDQYDMIVDLHVNYRVCSHCRIPLNKSAGNPSVNAYEWFDYGALLEAFSVGAGLPKLSGQPQVYIQSSHRESVKALDLGSDYCVIHRISNNDEKDWDDRRWSLLIDWLISEYKLNVVEVGAGARGSAPSFTGKGWRSLYNKTSILETAEVIRNAKAFIGVDSGPAHLANAVNTPGIVLLGRVGPFRKYNPFTGFYSESSKGVKLVRNLTGPVREVPLSDVKEGINYILKINEKVGFDEHLLTEDKQIPTFSLSSQISSPDIEEQTVYPRVFSFYLPQFHPIPENSFSHGAGFTEWNNVINTKPVFKGHYQPRQPGELGYYDLRAPEVMEAQIELATDYGISGFCFYYYYFNGKKLLFRPIDNYIKSSSKAPFFFLWANENWTKRWDGGNNEVIIKQEHNDEDDAVFLSNLLPIFEDSRYLKIDGKPLLMIYKAHLFPNIKRAVETWRCLIEKAGYPGIYLVMVDDWTPITHIRDYGFDAAYAIPSNLTYPEMEVDESDLYDLPKSFRGRLIDYYKFSSFHIGRSFPEYKRFHTVMAPWDNTPRYRNKAIIHVNTENDSYKNWVVSAYVDTYKRFSKSERIMFIHSWNEWCEGTNIEPDGRYGRKKLEQTKEAIRLGKEVIDIHQRVAGDPSSVLHWRRYEFEQREAAHRLEKLAFSQITDMSEECGRLRAELHSIRTSKAWKLIRRLRKIKRFISLKF